MERHSNPKSSLNGNGSGLLPMGNPSVSVAAAAAAAVAAAANSSLPLMPHLPNTVGSTGGSSNAAVAAMQMLPQQMITAGTRKDCIMLRGLPYEAQIEHILEFLGDHAQSIVYHGVHMVQNPQVSQLTR